MFLWFNGVAQGMVIEGTEFESCTKTSFCFFRAGHYERGCTVLFCVFFSDVRQKSLGLIKKNIYIYIYWAVSVQKHKLTALRVSICYSRVGSREPSITYLVTLSMTSSLFPWNPSSTTATQSGRRAREAHLKDKAMSLDPHSINRRNELN